MRNVSAYDATSLPCGENELSHPQLLSALSAKSPPVSEKGGGQSATNLFLADNVVYHPPGEAGSSRFGFGGQIYDSQKLSEITTNYHKLPQITTNYQKSPQITTKDF